MAGEPHINDIGTILEFTIVDDTEAIVNLATATSIKIIMKKPDGTMYEKTGVVDVAPTTGIVRYTIIDGDFDQTGKYKVQAKVVMPSSTLYSSIASFKVLANL